MLLAEPAGSIELYLTLLSSLRDKVKSETFVDKKTDSNDNDSYRP